MTKTEYIAAYAQPAEEMVHSAVFLALLETAREENPFAVMTGSDPTSVVKLAGASVGWHECIRFLKSAHKIQQKSAPREHAGHYQDPDKIENPNKPK